MRVFRISQAYKHYAKYNRKRNHNDLYTSNVFKLYSKLYMLAQGGKHFKKTIIGCYKHMYSLVSVYRHTITFTYFHLQFNKAAVIKFCNAQQHAGTLFFKFFLKKNFYKNFNTNTCIYTYTDITTGEF